jgi:transcriptional regulator with XRE-family HTH domain
MKKFSEILGDLMKEKGISQSALSRHLGISQQTVGTYLNKGYEPSFDIMIKIAKFFCVSMDFLFGLKDY